MGHFSNSNMGLSRHGAARVALEKIWASLPRQVFERKIMASPPTVNINTTATLSGQNIPSVTSPTSHTSVLNIDFFTFCKGGNVQIASTASLILSQHVMAKHVKKSNTPDLNNNTFGVVFDFIGSSLDIKAFNYFATGYFLLKIDGEYTTTTHYELPNDSNQKYININFGSLGKRRIEIIFSSSCFGGVIIGPNDTVIKANNKPSPHVIIVGDSFVEGLNATNNSALNSFGSFFGDYVGWDNVWLSGVAGTGYLNNATTKYTFRQRVSTDVINHNPDIVIITGGVNDNITYTQDQIYIEAKLLYQNIRESLPNALLIVMGAFAWKGAEGLYSSGIMVVNKAIKQAAQETSGVIFIDVLESTLETPAITGTLSAGTTLSATAFSSNALFPIGSTVEIDGENPTKTIRCVIKTISGTSSPYTYGVITTGQEHSAGASVIQKGNCFWTGTGKVGATTGYGNCDIFVSSGGQHPSEIGHQSLGLICAEKVIDVLKNI